MIKKDLSIIVVDDEANFRNFLYDALVPEGYSVDKASNGAEGLTKIKSKDYDLAFIDVKMPKKDGLTLLKEALIIRPTLHIIIMSALSNLDNVITAIKSGAFYFISKPIDLSLLYKFVEKVESYKKVNRENTSLRKKLELYETNKPIIGNSPLLLAEIEKAIKIAKTDASCIIFGESGTGKELICELIHKKSLRHKGAFYKINCAAIPKNLLESELFGYEKGAFTGAYQTTKGMFELADNGSLFLDEIGDMDISLQAKILRVLESGEFYRIGGQRAIHTNVRIISATHQNLLNKIAQNEFREDLYYRLNVISITLPPLRERKDDIPLLVKYLIKELSLKNTIKEKDLSKEALSYLVNYPFKGNIRELKNILERALVLSSSDIIELSGVVNMETSAKDNENITINVKVGTTMADIETMVIQSTLALFNGDKNKTANSLGISTRKVFYKVK